MPTIARRGHRLAYALAANNLNLWQISLDPAEPAKAGKPAQLIASTHIQVDPQYSQDGKKIAFMSDRSGTAEIWVADGDGQNQMPITHMNVSGSPSWSPDGREIAFDSGQVGTQTFG